MSGKTAPFFLSILFLSLLTCGGEIDVLSYNVENLFDDRDDGREYPEYRGEAWTTELYGKKLSALARAVREASFRGPDVLCLQEIESERALRDLRDRRLKNRGYRYLVFVPQAGAATSVACLSRLPILRTRVHEVGSFEGTPLRNILEIQIEHEGSVLYLFNNHWKSKTGGEERTAFARRLAAEVLTNRIRGIIRSDPKADLLVVGDLNENLEDYGDAGYQTATVPYRAAGSRADPPNVLFLTAVRQQAGLREDRVVLYEPWYEIRPEERGSSVYRDRWQTPDRILLSAGLFDEAGFSYSPGSFQVVKAGYLLDSDTGFPRRWQPGTGGATSGTSDHLPLRLTLRYR